MIRLSKLILRINTLVNVYFCGYFPVTDSTIIWLKQFCNSFCGSALNDKNVLIEDISILDMWSTFIIENIKWI